MDDWPICWQMVKLVIWGYIMLLSLFCIWSPHIIFIFSTSFLKALIPSILTKAAKGRLAAHKLAVKLSHFNLIFSFWSQKGNRISLTFEPCVCNTYLAQQLHLPKLEINTSTGDGFKFLKNSQLFLQQFHFWVSVLICNVLKALATKILMAISLNLEIA